MSTSWKTVRVFISSTFRDMHAERDYLVKIAFPRLREWCEARRLHLIDIDLRWGVTREEAENGGAVDICLKEIDASRPFFLCLLGEQYGWVTRTPPALAAGADGASDRPMSVTHLEILYGALGASHASSKAPPSEAFFYFREPEALPDPEAVTALSPAERDAYRAAYFAPSGDGGFNPRAALEDLKTAIRARYEAQGKVFTYPCRWDESASVPGAPNRLGGLVDFDALGARVEDDLKRAITAQYGDHLSALGEIEDPLDEEHALHLAFVATRTQIHVPDAGAQRALDAYIKGDDSRPAVLSGPPGSGKSAALAYWAEANGNLGARRLLSDQDATLLFRAVGASPGSTRLASLLGNICEELARIFVARGASFPKLSGDPAETPRVWAHYLTIAAGVSPGPIVILIDGFDQLAGQSDPGFASWLPSALPAKVRLVASAMAPSSKAAHADEIEGAGKWLSAFRARKFPEIAMAPLDEVRRRKIIQELPSIFAKSLDEAQVDALLANPATRNPLFLCVALQELRVFGSFDKLGAAIAALPTPATPDDPSSALDLIFSAILGRLEDDARAEAPGAIARVFALLSCARDGLTERELEALLATAFPDIGAKRLRDALQGALRQMRPYLVRKETRGGVLVDFFHRSFWRAARRRYVAETPSLLARQRDIARYFEVQPTLEAPGGGGGAARDLASQTPPLETLGARSDGVNYRKASDLAWQRIQILELSGAKDDEAALGRLLTDWEYLQAKYEAGLIFELAQEIGAARLLITEAESGGETLALIGEAINRDLHFIARNQADYGQALFQCLWNACWWYDHPSAAGHYENSKAIERLFDGRMAAWSQAYRAGMGVKRPGRSWLRQLRPSEPRIGAGTEKVFATYKNRVTSLAYAPDGRYLITGSFEPNVVLWDLVSGQEVYRIERVGGRVLSIAISPDGQSFVLGLDAKLSLETALIYSLASGQRLQTLKGHRTNVTHVEFSTSGAQVLTASTDATASVWDAATGQRLSGVGKVKSEKQVGLPLPARLMPAGDLLIYAPEKKKSLVIWNWRRERQIAEIGTGRIWSALTVSPDGAWAAAANERTPWVFDLRAFGARPRSFASRILGRDRATAPLNLGDNREEIRSMDFSPDGKKLVIGGKESVRVWDLEHKEGREIARHRSPINQVAFSPDGSRVASGSGGLVISQSVREDDHSVRITNIAKSSLEFRPVGHASQIRALEYSPGGESIATGSGNDKNSTFHVWSADALTPLGRTPRTTEDFDQIVFSPDGARIASAGMRSPTHLWPLSDLGAPMILEDDRLYIKHIAFCPLDQTLWSGGSTEVAATPTKVFDSMSGHLLRTADASVIARAFTRDGAFFASFIAHDGYSSRVCVLDTKSLSVLADIEKTQGQVRTAAFSRDGETLAFSLSAADIVIWRWKEARLLHRLRGHPSIPEFLAFSDDGENLTSACHREVRIWDIATGACVETYIGNGALAQMARAPKARLLWALSAGAEFRVIERPSGRIIASAPGSWALLARHPREDVWAGASQEHLNAWRLETTTQTVRDR